MKDKADTAVDETMVYRTTTTTDSYLQAERKMIDLLAHAFYHRPSNYATYSGKGLNPSCVSNSLRVNGEADPCTVFADKWG